MRRSERAPADIGKGGSYMIAHWAFGASAALLCWGLWAFFPKLAVKYISPMSSLVFEALGVAAIGIMAALFLGRGIETDPRGAIPAILTGVFGGIGLYFYFAAARHGPIAVVAALTALYPVVTVLLAILLLHERLNWIQALGVVLALIAGGLLAWEPK
jgi:transporter family protein